MPIRTDRSGERQAGAAAGISAPIVPGILPITRFPQVLRFAARCGTSIPPWLHERFAGLDAYEETPPLLASSLEI